MSLNADQAVPSRSALAEHDIGAEAHRPDVLFLAAAVVVHHDRVLIVRRSKTERFLPCVWGVPCGKVDPEEEAHDAAVRELREETGLNGTVVRRLGKSVFRSRWRGQMVKNVQINFLVRPLGEPGQISLAKADQAAAWLHRDEVEHFDGLDEYNLEVLGQWLAMKRLYLWARSLRPTRALRLRYSDAPDSPAGKMLASVTESGQDFLAARKRE